MTGDHISTDAGDLVIHPVNHAGMVTTWNGTLMVLKRNEPRQWRELCKGEHVIIVPPAIACR